MRTEVSKVTFSTRVDFSPKVLEDRVEIMGVFGVVVAFVDNMVRFLHNLEETRQLSDDLLIKSLLCFPKVIFAINDNADRIVIKFTLVFIV